MNRRSLAVPLLLALVALTLWRLLAEVHAGLELFGDEAQYWTWSLEPDWGYYSKPPMVAWAIWLGTRLFGDGEAAIRALAAVIYPLTAGVLYLLARRLFRDRAEGETMAFWAALAYATLPMVSMGAWLITTDAFLLFFWSLSLYFLARALESGRWRDWLWLGLAAGLGLMSKYSMVFFALGLAAYLALTPARRRLFLDPRPYATALVALLVVTPNLLWNASHDFVSFQHTAEISQLDKRWFHPDSLLEFFLAQFGVFGPLTFAGLLLLAVRPKTWFADERLRFLAAFSLAPLAAFLLLSLLSRAFANWAAFSYAAAAVLVAAAWTVAGRRGWLITALAVNLLAAGTLYHLHDITDALGIQLTRKTDPYGRITGYRELGAQVAGRLRGIPGARLLVDDRKLYALMRYYARPDSEGARLLNPGGAIDNHYALTADIRNAPEGEFLLVSRLDLDTDLALWFAEVEALPAIEVRPYPDHVMAFRVWRLRDYRGP